LELRVAAEDKDAAVYQYLLENAGRTLLFCNSIKSVRRVDGLLRALNVNSRAIHAQMQQRQRLRSLDAFKAAPIGVLVATDVAARGLDVARIQHVVHYDIARSPQTYTHRSGRTARAGNSGTAISIVSPEDAASHELVLANLPRGAISMYRLDTTAVSERVRLAKQIFTASFVDMQTSKQEHWLQDMARDTGLELDDYMRSERGAEEERVRAAAVKKRGLEEKKRSLKSMLDRPAESKGQKNSSALGLPPRRKGSFIVVAK
jgi:ATP-dependent RNA helicase DDX24/MAK5